jgi:hypothetical protein
MPTVKPSYCTRPQVETCYECSLTSYGKDCHNNPVDIPIYECTRCGARWVGKEGRSKPQTCPNPKCRSPYWDRERIKNVKPSK